MIVRYYKDKLVIIWIDIHYDFNNLETTHSNNVN
ncbi:hypothetical protein JJB34_10110 [Clostridium perfringens]|nr:hypothetical protein [Clostridium perfringens]MBO3362420.1 hypothetical protein [Clostridium perfringens]HAT4363568.1 hypothetical protein [Clostridium perfringens]